MSNQEIRELAKRFAHDAEAYERARPGFPAELDEIILPLSGLDVVEVGAGTGKFTRNLFERGANVIAVEPVDEMRRVLERELPSVTAMSGTAEAIPVDDLSADRYVAIEAFHWFDHAKAWSEIRRTLRPGGKILLAWLRRHIGYPWQRPVYEALQQVTGPVTKRFEFADRWHSGWGDDFTQLARHDIVYELDYTVEKLQAMFGTYSYVVDLSEQRRLELLQEIADIVRRHEERDVFPMRLELEAWTCDRR